MVDRPSAPCGVQTEFLDGDAQGLHVEVEERVEDGHRGRLEQEDKLDPHLVMISLTNSITIRIRTGMVIFI